MKIIEIWPRGYAHESGLARVTVADDVDPASEARKFGALACVFSVRPILPKVEDVDPAYARMMSRNDNS